VYPGYQTSDNKYLLKKTKTKTPTILAYVINTAFIYNISKGN
jgi:hypothetical protein